MSRAAFPSGRKFLLLLALAAAIIGGAWWWQRPSSEPVYKGQRLSKWLADLEPSAWMLPDTGQLRDLGADAVPWLVYTVEHGRHQVNKPGPLPFDNAPDWLRRLLPDRWGGLRRSRARDERVMAAEALCVLGPKAAPAIPALARTLEAGYDPLSVVAARALHSIGPASWPAVEDLLNHPTRGRLLLLHNMGVRTKPPVPDSEIERAVSALVKACHDPDPEVRIWALSGIRGCGAFPQESTLYGPALAAAIRLFSDPQPRVRCAAADTIVGFGARATIAIPRLIEMLDDPDVSVRIRTANSLWLVDRTEKRSAARLRVMALLDADPDCRSGAAYALKRLGIPVEEKPASPEASLAR